MSNSILDQAEIDALLNAVQAEEGMADAAGSGGKVSIKPYAFQPPDLISRTQFRGLFAIHERFTRELQASLSLLLRTRVEMRLLSVDQQRYVDFAAALAGLTNIHMFDAKPLPGTGLVDFSMPVVFGILDHQLGGDGSSKPPERPLTAVETAIIEPILRMFFRGLQDALSEELQVEIQRVGTESNAEYAHITTPEGPVVAVCIEVEVGAACGLVSICYPAPMVASVLWEMQSRTAVQEAPGHEAETAESRRTLLASLMDVPVTVPAILAEFQLSARDWLDLAPGDVLVLPTRIQDPIRVDVEGWPLYHGRPGRVGKRLAVRVLRPVMQKPEEKIDVLLT